MNATSPLSRLLIQTSVIAIGAVLLCAFDNASAQVTIVEQTSPTLGILMSGASGRNFILNTDDTVSGTDAGDYVTGADSGRLNISKSGGNQSATIVADNFATTGGVTIISVPCRWRNDAPQTCDGSGITKTIQGTARPLWLGVEINTTQTHSGSDTASASYDITVTLI